MSDEKLDKDPEAEVEPKGEATEAEATQVTDSVQEPEASAEQTVTAGETRISPATMQESAEGDQKAAATKRNRVVAVAACCLVALAALIGGVGYVSGAFGGASQPAQETAAEAADSSSSDAKATSQDAEQSKADGATAADAAATADQAEQPQEQTTQAEAAPAQESPASSGEASSSSDSGDAGASSGDSAEAPAEEPAAEPEPTPAPAPAPEPTPEPTPATITVYVTIDSSRANHYDSSWPTSMGSRSVTLSEGSSVYDALCAMGVSVGKNGSGYVYVTSINGLAEKLCGSLSGWTYSVDGVFSMKSCDNYKLSGGEDVRWIYSTNDEPTMPM